MWNFDDELSVRDCVRGVVVDNRAGVCRLLLETGKTPSPFSAAYGNRPRCSVPF